MEFERGEQVVVIGPGSRIGTGAVTFDDGGDVTVLFDGYEASNSVHRESVFNEADAVRIFRLGQWAEKHAEPALKSVDEIDCPNCRHNVIKSRTALAALPKEKP